jgi:hypothetical protein
MASVEEIIAAAARYYKVRQADIKGHNRHATVFRARATAMFLARKYTHESYNEIGKRFGNRHHTTVLASIRSSAISSKDVEDIEKLLQSKDTLFEDFYGKVRDAIFQRTKVDIDEWPAIRHVLHRYPRENDLEPKRQLVLPI